MIIFVQQIYKQTHRDLNHAPGGMIGFQILASHHFDVRVSIIKYWAENSHFMLMKHGYFIILIEIIIIVVLAGLCLIGQPDHTSNQDDNSSQFIPIEAEDLVITVSNKSTFDNHTHVFVLENKSVYKVVTQYWEVGNSNLSGTYLNLSYELLSLINNNYSYKVPLTLTYFELDNATYDRVCEDTKKVDFSNDTYDPVFFYGVVPGGYQIDIFLDGYQDSIRYIWGDYPNIETQELAELVLELNK